MTSFFTGMLRIMLPLLLDIYFIGETNRITKSLLVNAIVIKEAISISHLQRLSTKIVAGIKLITQCPRLERKCYLCIIKSCHHV